MPSTYTPRNEWNETLSNAFYRSKQKQRLGCYSHVTRTKHSDWMAATGKKYIRLTGKKKINLDTKNEMSRQFTWGIFMHKICSAVDGGSFLQFRRCKMF